MIWVNTCVRTIKLKHLRVLEVTRISEKVIQKFYTAGGEGKGGATPLPPPRWWRGKKENYLCTYGNAVAVGVDTDVRDRYAGAAYLSCIINDQVAFAEIHSAKPAAAVELVLVLVADDLERSRVTLLCNIN